MNIESRNTATWSTGMTRVVRVRALEPVGQTQPSFADSSWSQLTGLVAAWLERSHEGSVQKSNL
jgi:hypothetical protein